MSVFVLVLDELLKEGIPFLLGVFLEGIPDESEMIQDLDSFVRQIARRWLFVAIIVVMSVWKDEGLDESVAIVGSKSSSHLIILLLLLKCAHFAAKFVDPWIEFV